MKRQIHPVLLLIVLTGLLLASCAKTEPPSLPPAAPPEPSTLPTALFSPLPSPTEEAPPAMELDLSVMGPGMAYATLYNILFEPASYVGQRLRVSGPYEENVIGASGITYRFIVVADRQACCAQGLEFVLADDEAVYPERRWKSAACWNPIRRTTRPMCASWPTSCASYNPIAGIKAGYPQTTYEGTLYVFRGS